MKANFWEFGPAGFKEAEKSIEIGKGELDSAWEHLGQTKTLGTVEKVEEFLNNRRFEDAAAMRNPERTI